MMAEVSNNMVLLEKEGRLATITLNRPDKLNALSLSMMDEFRQVLEAIRLDDDISVVLITGAGRAFSVGADLEFLHSLSDPSSFRKALKHYWHDNFNTIENMEKLFVAAINGTAIGGAVELALVCDLRLACEGVSFAMPQITYGLIPDSGGTNRLARLVGSASAKELILSGRKISTEDAFRIGLLNRVLPAENFLAEVRNWVGDYLDKSPAALGLGKLAINRSWDLDIQAGLDDAGMLQSILLNSPEYREAMRLYSEKAKKK